MRCDEYRRYSFGEIPEEAFEAHRRGCAACDEAVRLDSMIESEARELPVHDSAPGLWNRIAADLRREQRDAAAPEHRAAKVLPWPDPRRARIWRMAAVLVVAVGLGTVGLLAPWRQTTTPQPETLLTERALDRVEATEAQYERAIADLENVTRPVLSALDIELALHYRERLETIDTQIRRCETVLARDNGNAHVRRYLLAALQDKRDTLTHLSTLAMLDESGPRNDSERIDP